MNRQSFTDTPATPAGPGSPDASRLGAELEAARPDVEALVDTPFDDTRLDRQREAILARLTESGDRRVLAFPARDRQRLRRDRPAMRWLAAAAAAGLFIGVAAGPSFNAIVRAPLFGPGHEASAVRRAPAPEWSPVVSDGDPAPGYGHDELFLSEMESAVNNRVVAGLRALDDLTPRPTIASIQVSR